MVTASGERFTEWCHMAYNTSSGAFQPLWDANMTTTSTAATVVSSSSSSSSSSLTVAVAVAVQCPVTSVFEWYNHTVDAGEMFNLAADPNPSPAARAAMDVLRKQLHDGWRAALQPQPPSSLQPARSSLMGLAEQSIHHTKQQQTGANRSVMG